MNVFSNMKSNWNAKISSYQALDSKDKKTFWKEALINNAMYRPFCRTSSRSDRMYFRISAAVCNLCYQNVPGSSGYADLAGYPDCHRSGRSGRLGQWFLRGEVLSASVYRNTGNTADRIRLPADVHYDQRQQWSAAFRT